MPRKKAEKKFKYTIRKNGILYVKYPVPGVKYPVWRICRTETQSEVDAIIEEIKAEQSSSQAIAAAPVTVENLLSDWLKSRRNKIAARSFQDYTDQVKVIAEQIGTIPLAELQPIEIEKFYLSLEESGKLWQVERIHRCFRAALNYAVRLRLRADNPSRFVEPSRLKRKEIYPLSSDEAKRFLAACNGDKHGLVFEIALFTGMRPSEYLALRWSDIDFDKNHLRVSRSLKRLRGEKFEIGELKTKSSRRVIPLSASLIEKLKNHRREAAKNKYDLVFAAENGEPLSTHNLARRNFKNILKAAEIDTTKFNPYSLRHSCATLLFASGVSVKTVQERLGHSSANITMDTYIHFIPSLQDEATDKLTEMLYNK